MTNVTWSITSWISLFFLFNFLFILAISFSLSRISSFVSNILFFYSFSSWCPLDGALWSANQGEISKWKPSLTIVLSFDNPSARSWISWIDFSWLSSFCSYSFCSLFKSTRDLKDIDKWRTKLEFENTDVRRVHRYNSERPPQEKRFPLRSSRAQVSWLVGYIAEIVQF